MFGNDLFTGMPEWLKKKMMKKRLMESPITAAEAESMSNPFMQVNETDLSGPGRMPVENSEGIVTGSGMHPGEESGYQPLGTQNPIPKNIAHPNEAPIYRTPQGTPAVASGPKLTPEARQTYTGYTKSLDKTFTMAALQSAIPEDQPAPRGVWGGGAHGGGNNLADMQPFLTGERRKKKNPALWRYS